MSDLVHIWEQPKASQVYLIAGWRQWADAGNVSSGLPAYLADLTGARKIGEILPNSFYLFQIPGTHHFLRPEVTLEDGFVQEMERPANEFYYWEDGQTGLVIFLGDEPHLHADTYADAFLDAVQQLGVQRVVGVGGVYGAMPYDKDREVSCVYSLRALKDELTDYAVRFSQYQGGATIGTYLVDRAKERGVEFLLFYAFVPAYDFSELSNLVQGIRIESDYRAWYELTRRFNHMFGLHLDLMELERQSEELVQAVEHQIDELDRKVPQLKVREHLAQWTEDFTEHPFLPLDDVWEEALEDVWEDLED
jgi:proteasome assembly chaperone (PAC2) family protein